MTISQSVCHGRQARCRRWRGALLASLLLLVMTACAPLAPRNPMAIWAASDNYNQRGPQLIVLHYTDEGSVEQSLETLQTRNSGGPVSAHYLLARDGRIYQLVSDEHRAWHAGGGHWGSISDVNSASLGIEIANNGNEPFPPAQIEALLRLLGDLTQRWGIPCTAIIGHQDMAPRRKPDPGPLFPWEQLAAAGFGLWPDPPAARQVVPPGFDPWLALVALGYPVQYRQDTVRAFHNHFRGMGGTELDAVDRSILYNLAGKLKSGERRDACRKPA